MPVEQFAEIAKENGLNGTSYTSVKEAYDAAKEKATENDTIFVGGSTFIVADMLESTL